MQLCAPHSHEKPRSCFMPLQAREHVRPTGDCRWPRKLVQEISNSTPVPERCPEAGIGSLFSAWLSHLEHSKGLAESHLRSSRDRPSPAPQKGQGMFTRQLSLLDVTLEAGSPEPALSCPDLELNTRTSVPGPTSEMGIWSTQILGSHPQHLLLTSLGKCHPRFKRRNSPIALLLPSHSRPTVQQPCSRLSSSEEIAYPYAGVHLLRHSIYVCRWYFQFLLPLFGP
jgi:hypothetical protein